jgi:hypothetical protein
LEVIFSKAPPPAHYAILWNIFWKFIVAGGVAVILQPHRDCSQSPATAGRVPPAKYAAFIASVGEIKSSNRIIAHPFGAFCLWCANFSSTRSRTQKKNMLISTPMAIVEM